MIRQLTIIAVAATLAGCGLAETAATGATSAAAAAEQAREGQRQMDKVRTDIDAAQKTADANRVAAEAAAE